MNGNLNFTALFRELSALDHVVGVGRGNKWRRGTDTGEEAVIVFVDKKQPHSGLMRGQIIPPKIENKPTDVIEVGQVRFLGTGFTEKERPAQPGISIGHFRISAGTFGAVVYDRATGKPFILSNNHVLACATDGTDGRSALDDPILQPGTYDGGNLEIGKIGELKRFIPVYREVMRPICRYARSFESILNYIINGIYPEYHVNVMRADPRLNRVDCALAEPDSPELITPEIMAIGKIAGVKSAEIGMAVKKSGRTTGLTHSLIIASDVTLKVQIEEREYGVFQDQVLAGPMSMPGDSGSLILTEDNYAVGLLFAGSDQVTMFNRIEHVLDALQVDLLPNHTTGAG